jgi:hypothetical protein
MQNLREQNPERALMVERNYVQQNPNLPTNSLAATYKVDQYKIQPQPPQNLAHQFHEIDQYKVQQQQTSQNSVPQYQQVMKAAQYPNDVQEIQLQQPSYGLPQQSQTTAPQPTVFLF